MSIPTENADIEARADPGSAFPEDDEKIEVRTTVH